MGLLVHRGAEFASLSLHWAPPAVGLLRLGHYHNCLVAQVVWDWQAHYKRSGQASLVLVVGIWAEHSSLMEGCLEWKHSPLL